MAIDKQHILDEIRRITEANGGKAPGRDKFANESGIKESDWFPDHWLRWSDAIREAGFFPNKFQTAYEKDVLLEKFVALIRELKHVPIRGELRRKSKQDPSFPNEKTFSRLGGKGRLVAAVIEYCRNRSGFEDVLNICCGELASTGSSLSNERSTPHVNEISGFVYLIKYGRHYKIGKTNAVGRRQYELAIQLPEKANTVHVIKTDDPGGIEAYWHKRFEAKRGNGEWFELTAEDIKAFRRRKFM